MHDPKDTSLPPEERFDLLSEHIIDACGFKLIPYEEARTLAVDFATQFMDINKASNPKILTQYLERFCQPGNEKQLALTLEYIAIGGLQEYDENNPDFIFAMALVNLVRSLQQGEDVLTFHTFPAYAVELQSRNPLTELLSQRN